MTLSVGRRKMRILQNESFNFKSQQVENSNILQHTGHCLEYFWIAIRFASKYTVRDMSRECDLQQLTAFKSHNRYGRNLCSPDNLNPSIVSSVRHCFLYQGRFLLTFIIKLTQLYVAEVYLQCK